MLVKHWLQNLFPRFRFPAASQRREFAQKRKSQRDNGQSVGIVQVAENLEDRTLLAAAITGIQDDNGPVNNDGITNDPSLFLEGTVEAGETVEITVGGVVQGTVIDTDSDGLWSFNGWGNFADGTYTIGAQQITGAGADPAPVTTMVTVETVEPGVTIGGPAGMTGAAAFQATFTFDEPVYGFAQGDIAVVNGSLSNFSGSDGDTVFTVDVTPAADGTVSLDVAAGAATDLAGNDNTAAVQYTVTADVTPPTATLSGPSGPTNMSPLPITLDFNEGVTGLLDSEIVIGNGTISNFSDNGGGNYTFDVTPVADGTVTVDVPANVADDAAGNGNTAATQYSVDVDTTGPGVAIGAPSETDANSADTIDFIVTFSDLQGGSVDLEAVDITLNSTGTASGTVSVIDGNTATPTVRITNATGDGTLSITVAAGAAMDGLGNDSLVAGPSTSFNVDNTPPVVMIGAPDDLLVNDSGTVNFPVTITGADNFNLTAGDITITSTTGGTETVTIIDGGTATPTIQITNATGDGTIAVSVDAGTSSDVAGNDDLGAGPSAAFTVDNTDPTVAVTGPASPTSSTPFVATITFNEVVVDFLVGDVTVTNGTASNLQDMGGGVFTVDITPTANGDVTVDVAVAVATDEAGNDNEAAPAAFVVEFIDPVNPIITGTAGDDAIEVFRDGGDIVVERNAVEIFRQAEAGVADMQVNGGDGDDNLSINVDGGIALPITYDGQGNTAAGDTLTLSGASGGDVTHVFIDDNSGTVEAGTNGLISYSGIEPIVDNMDAAGRIFTFTGADETITLSDDGVADDGVSFIDSTLGESVTFTNPTSFLTVNSHSGTDILNVEGLDGLFNAPMFLLLSADDTIRFQTNDTDTGTHAINAQADDIQVNGVTLTTRGNLTGDVSVDAGGTIAASGTLDIGIGSSGTGVNLSGTLDVDSHIVNLLDLDFANMGVTTTIDGGTLNATNGLLLDNGEALSGNGTVAGRVVGFVGSTITADGALSLGDAAIINGYSNSGTLNVGTHDVTLLDADEALLGISTTLNGGTLTAANGVELSGNDDISGVGTINANVTTDTGSVTPGLSPGLLNVVGDLDGEDGTFNMEIDGVTTAGTDYDQIAVVGAVDVTNADLVLSGTYAGGALGETVVLFDNDGADAVIGEFTGLTNGADVAFAGGTWRLFYDGGDGNDIILTYVPAALPEIFVNDDFTMPNGTWIVDADPNTAGDQNAVIGVNAFDTIQEGVDAVDVDGQVSITDGAGDAAVYAEAVTITKNLALVGTAGDASYVTVTNAGGTGIAIDPPATWTEIDSLTVDGNGANGIWVGALTGNVDITNVVTSDNATNGINIDGVGGTITLTDVDATGNTEVGALILNSGTINVWTSSFTFNQDGLAISGAGDVAVTDVNADMNSNATTDAIGLFVDGADSVTVTNGTYNDNESAGIDILNVAGTVTLNNVSAAGNSDGGSSSGAIVDTALEVLVDGGNFSGNELTGLEIADVTNGVTLQNGVVVNNNTNGFEDGDGINIFLVGTVTISDTSASGNQHRGIEIIDVGGSVDITDTVADGNVNANEDGGGIEVSIADSVTITNTDADGNQAGGIGIYDITNGVTLDGASGTNSANADPASGVGAIVDNAGWLNILNSDFTGNDFVGLAVFDVLGAVDLDGVQADSNADDGLFINGAGDVTIADSWLTNNNRGFDINNVANLTVDNSEVSGNAVDNLANTIAGTLTISTDPAGTVDDVHVNTPAVGGTDFIGVDQGGSLQNLINFTNVADIDIQLLGADDTATVAPHATTTINVDGGAPTSTPPGDYLTYLTPMGETSTLTLDGGDLEGDAGTISVTGGFADVSYNDIEDLTFSGSIVVVGTAGDDLLEIIATNATDGTYQVTTDGVAGPIVNFTGATDFTFNGGDGDDVLRINNPAGGLFAPMSGIFFNGEGEAGDVANNPPGDALEILGGVAGTVEHIIANEADGSISYDGTTTVWYTGLEPVLDTITANNRIFTFTSANDETITLSDDAVAGDGMNLIDSTDGEAITFLAPNDLLRINTGGGGADSLDVQGVDSTFDAGLLVLSDGSDVTDFTTNPTDIGSGTLDVNTGSISVDADVTTTGNVFLNAGPNGIDGTGTLSGANLVANAGDGIQLNTAVDDINASVSGTGDITIVETDAVVLSDVDTNDGSISVQAGGQIDAVDVIAGGAGDVDISNTAGDILVDDVQAVGNTLTITSTAGAIEELGVDPAADLIADDMNLTAANGIGQSAQIEIDASAAGGMGLTADVTGTGMIDLFDTTGGLRVLSATTNDGDIRIISDGNLLLETVDAGGASDVFGQSINGNVTADDVQAVDDTVTLISAGSIEEEGSDADADITAADVNLTAQTGIGAADTLEVDAGDTAPNGLSAEVLNVGNIDISDPNGLRVVLAETVDGSIDLETTGAGDLTLEEVFAGGANDVTATATDGDMLVTEVNADGDLATLTASGSILDNGDADTDVTAADLIATATAGTIGTGADSLETSVDNLEATAGGGIWIFNEQSLTIGGISPAVGVSAGDNIRINALGFIDVTEDVTNTMGNIDLLAFDGPGGGDNVTVRTGTSVTSDAGDVNLHGGDDVIIENAATVSAAAGKVSLFADFANADPGVGGAIRVLGTLVSSSQAMAMGGPDGDFIQIMPGVNDSVDSLLADGAGGDDIYEVWYGRLNGGANAVDIRDTGAGDNDSATVIGTAADETIIVHNNEANGVAPVTGGFSDNTTTGENVTYSETLERLTVRGEDGNELFDVQPSQSTIITIDGGAPGFGEPNAPGGTPDGPGDILDLDTFNQTFTIIGKSIFTNGGDPDAFERINFRRIEGLPLDPIGTSGDPDPLRFDFDDYHENTEAGYESVIGGRLYGDPILGTPGSDFGWVDTAPNSNAVTNSSVFLTDLFGDHHTDTADQTFRVDVDNGWYLVSAKIGNQGTALDTINITNADTGDLLIGDYEVDHQIGTVTFPVLVQDGTMDLTFSGTGGVADLWTLSGLEIRPGNLLTFGSPDPAPLESDGVTIDTFQGFDATPNAIITLYAGLDSDGDDIPDIDLEITTADLDPIIDGVQVMADANGEFSYDVLRPTGVGTGFVAMSELSGDQTGCLAIDYVGASIRRFDFDGAQDLTETPEAAPGGDESDFISVRKTNDPETSRFEYDSTFGYGWLDGSTTYATDRGLGHVASTTLPNLLQDVHYGLAPQVFRADLGEGTYEVTVSFGDPSAAATASVDVLVGNIVAEQANVTDVEYSYDQTHRTFVVETQFVDGKHQIQLEFSGATGFWSAAGVSFREVSEVGALAVTPPGGVETADGVSTANVTVTGATPGDVYTLATTRGTITQLDGMPIVDADADLQGIQIVAPAASFNFDIQSPVGTGDATITVEEINGAARGNAVQAYEGPSIQGFDFNAYANVTAAGFTGSRANPRFMPGDSSGWLGTQAIYEYDSVVAPTTATPDLYRDGVYGVGSPMAGARTFRVAVNALQDYDLRVYSGSRVFLVDQMMISVEGGAFTALAANTAAGSFTDTVLANVSDQNADGFLDITFSDNGGASTIWFANGIELADAGTLAAPAPLTFSGSQGAGADDVTVDQVGTLVDAAIDRLVDAGYDASAFDDVTVEVADLDDQGVVGLAGNGVITIDNDGFGHGWFLDDTPFDDAEFDLYIGGSESQASGGAASGKVDLLTVLMHELAHIAGAEDVDSELRPHNLMTATIGTSTRRLA